MTLTPSNIPADQGVSQALRDLAAGHGEFARLLGSDGVQEALRQFESADQEARRGQKTFKRLSVAAIATRFLAIAAGVSALLSSALDIGAGREVSQGFARWAIAVQYLSLAAGLGITVFLAKRKVFDRWMLSRSAAEASRITLFEAIMDGGRHAADALKLLPEKLALFVAQQVEGQGRYFRRRGEEHRRSALRTKQVIGYLSTLGIISLMPVLWVVLEAAGLLTFPTQSINQVFLLLGTIAAAGLSAADTLSRINLDARNAAKYAALSDRLEDLLAHELEPARLAAAEGRDAEVRGFVTKVHAELSQEYKDWELLRRELKRQAASEVETAVAKPRQPTP